MAVDTDVLIIGAGPIGLVNAWGMKKLNPSLKITVLEKYANYQRSHTLIMQAAQLEAIMRATHSEQDPTLVTLLTQLKKDPHIRTNTLQEIFTKLSEDSGVEIKREYPVYPETLQQTIQDDYPHVRLILGADGTHSVTSEALFPQGNQVKHEFDFVLQLRFEVNGEEKAPGVKIKKFYQQMARKGLIANEYVGHFSEGKTPITMQMMISKNDFLALQKATSKNPLRPFTGANPHENPAVELPQHLNSFLTTYLQYKIEDTTQSGQAIDQESIRISVNEAPATHAKRVITQHHQAAVVLMGDAALGLSYFKGLNAGLEASARFLTAMSSAIQDAYQNQEAMIKQLETYQTWFLNDFSPKKVKEVGRYSFWQIRSFMHTMKAVQSVKNMSMVEEDEDLTPAITDYFNHYSADSLANGINKNWRPFPHRAYDLVKFGQFDYVPLIHTAKKITKIFVDYFKPYKSKTQLIQDFKQPLVGIAHFFIGLGKTVVGVFTFNGWNLADGLFTLTRGIVELVTTPLTWLLKPIVRGVATLINGGYTAVEKNKGIQNLAEYGLRYLNRTNDKELANSKRIYELLAICNDIHRKFDKSISRGQRTALEMEEYKNYAAIRADNILDRQKLNHYFSLFQLKSSNQEVDNREPTLNLNSYKA